MLSFYQYLDAEMEQKVLLMTISGLEFMPALGELFEINGVEFIVIQIKHKLNTATMQQELEYYLMKSEDVYSIEIEYLDQDEEHFNNRGF